MSINGDMNINEDHIRVSLFPSLTINWVSITVISKNRK